MLSEISAHARLTHAARPEHGPSSIDQEEHLMLSSIRRSAAALAALGALGLGGAAIAGAADSSSSSSQKRALPSAAGAPPA